MHQVNGGGMAVSPDGRHLYVAGNDGLGGAALQVN